MALHVIVRLHARAGEEAAVEAALREVVGASRQEAGCISIHAFRSRRNASLFHIYSQWKDEAAFKIHGEMAHTRRFLEIVDPLLDPPREVIVNELLV